MATLLDTEISSTGFLQLPIGTTAQRPAIPVSGMIRYNTDEASIEAYVDGQWALIGLPPLEGAGGTVSTSGGYTVHTFTSNGTFTIS